ncbi:thioesterase [Lentzea sp. NEAU-D13]|uniref:Thioesterase n=1 Tax=Lentzea alba TaxID=2714351 RepID=A0A7C9VZ37_9PSEU|nr:alpha/beta fold hydrolase [Lentzea alba]NGY62598.1 thioesterase [Lentzea alba]
MSADVKVKLLCLPYAGAGASFYRHWQRQAGDALEIVPLQLPGRERLMDAEPYRDVHQAADGLLADLAPASGDRLALFGHSMGAVLAYELAHRLTRVPGVEVVRLFASGARAPFEQAGHGATGLADDEFLDRVAELTGYRDPMLELEELRELVLPVLRADIEMHERYAPSTDLALAAPITAVRAEDDPLVSREDVAAWEKVAGRGFESAEVPGGHMYLLDDIGPLLRLVTSSVG